MDFSDYLGLAAGVLTSAAFLPQLGRVWRTKSAGDVSATMLGALCVGVLLWAAYGILIGSAPIIGANVFTFFIASAILVLKLRYDRRLP